MTTVQWQRIKEITANALELDPSHRADFVNEACADDAFVHREVLQLISREPSQEGDLLTQPLANLRDVLAGRLAPDPLFAPGDVLNDRFQVVEFLGRGGMGEVYAAMDRELREKVALKTIHPAIASSAEIIERFKQEVRQTRSIAHPNVCRVYDLFCHVMPGGSSAWFLTMELLDGKPLGDFAEPLPFDQALPLIRQMAGALSAAHDRGIVHRDFKPSNVMLVPAGPRYYRAVVMDFGLAANVDSQTRDTGGTAAYIAPEQAAGAAPGAAADQFSLAMTIAEMLTGQVPAIDRTSETEAKKQLQEWFSELPRNLIKPSVRAALSRALAFYPQDRFSHVRGLLAAIDGSRRRKRRRIIVVAVAAAALLGLGFALLPNSGARLVDERRLTSQTDWSATPSISADGKWVAYASNRADESNVDIWLDSWLGRQARRLTTNPTEDSSPSISPDASSVVFRSERNGGGVYFIRANGTRERLLAAGGRHAVFSPDGRLVAYWTGNPDDSVASGQIYVVPPEGGSPRQIASDFIAAKYPLWSPDSNHLMFAGCRTNDPPFPSCNELWIADINGGPPTQTDALAALKAQGVDIFWHQKTWHGSRLVVGGRKATIDALWEIAISPKSWRVVGKPRQLTTGEARELEPALASSGAMAFGRISGSIHTWRLEFAAPGQTPQATKLTDATFGDCCPAATHDGRSLYFTRRVQVAHELFRKDLATGVETVVLTSPEEKYSPAPNVDGTKVAFESHRLDETSIDLFVEGQPPRTLCADCSHPMSWFGDNAIFYKTSDANLAILDIDTRESHLIPFDRDGMTVGEVDWSPDNQYLLATASARGDTKQVYAVRLPKSSASPAGPWILLTPEPQLAERPRWSKEGKVFYYLSNRDGHLCVWGQRFTPGETRPASAFPVMHYHANPRFSPAVIQNEMDRGFSFAGASMFLNIGEGIETIWAGKLQPQSLIERIRRNFFPQSLQ